MASQTLPQEVLDDITDYVATLGSNDLLKNLALASREYFLHRCRSYIFRKLHFAPSYILPRHTKMLDHKPSLFAYARILELNFRDLPSIEQEDTFARIVDHLHGIEHLIVSNPRGMFAWDVMSPVLRSTLQKVLARPTHLSLIGLFDFPLQVISSLTQLKGLDLRGDMTSLQERTEGPALGHIPIQWQLESLRWRTSQAFSSLAFFVELNPNSFHETLENLDICLSDTQTYLASWSLIMGACQTLKALTLRYTDADTMHVCLDDILNSGKSFPTFARLQYLSVELQIWDAGEVSPVLPCLFTDLVVALVGKNPQNSVKVVELRFLWSIRRVIANRHQASNLVDRALGDVFSDFTLFPQLQSIRVSFAPWVTGYSNAEEADTLKVHLAADARAAFHDVVSRGVVLDLDDPDTASRFEEFRAPLLLGFFTAKGF